jgi:hypothetical protein
MKIESLYLVLNTDRPVEEDATKLRGYIGSTFNRYPILHHHAPALIYTYPKVQYKVIGGTPAILGIGEGMSVLREIAPKISELLLSGSRYVVRQRVQYDQAMDMAPVRDAVQYRFITPWLALNQEHFERYLALTSWADKKMLLNSILIGNILSMAKGLDIVIDHELHVTTKVDPATVMFKGIKMIGFTGEFRVNYAIPEYFGIGKGVSAGFGTVKAAHGE